VRGKTPRTLPIHAGSLHLTSSVLTGDTKMFDLGKASEVTQAKVGPRFDPVTGMTQP